TTRTLESAAREPKPLHSGTAIPQAVQRARCGTSRAAAASARFVPPPCGKPDRSSSRGRAVPRTRPLERWNSAVHSRSGSWQRCLEATVRGQAEREYESSGEARLLTPLRATAAAAHA